MIRIKCIPEKVPYLVALIVLLSGCGGPVRNSDPRISDLIHQCFATVKESIFLSSRCQPIGGWPYCDNVKALNAEQTRLPNLPQFPATLRAFHEDPPYWSAQIRAQQAQFLKKDGDHLIIYGGISSGTQLEISQVSRWVDGENGVFWIAYADIRDGEFKGRRVLLSWQGFGQPGWIRTGYDPKARGSTPPAIDPEYLTRCGAEATAR
jgi:hypothetical protein